MRHRFTFIYCCKDLLKFEKKTQSPYWKAISNNRSD